MDPMIANAVPPPDVGWLLFLVGGQAIFSLLIVAFTIWMIIDCVREGREMYWIWLMLIFWGFGAAIYFLNYKLDGSASRSGLLKGHRQKQRIRELQAKIHNLDTAYHHGELGDEYLRAKRYADARKAFEASLERDPKSFEYRAHLGFALAGEGRHAEAWAILEPALAEQPTFEYGELMWQSARCLAALGRPAEAKDLYRALLKRHTYAEAQLELAELLQKTGEAAEARPILERIVADAPHTPKFQQRKEKKWVQKAKKALKKAA